MAILRQLAAGTHPLAGRWMLVGLVLTLLLLPSTRADAQETLDARIRTCLWSDDPAESAPACAGLERDASLASASRRTLHEVEAILREGPPAITTAALRQEIEVALPDGRSLPVIVELPSRYHPDVTWPLILAMHGGPPRTEPQARSGAEHMVEAWSGPTDDAGWIVAAPAMTTVVARDGRTDDRLPYDVLRPDAALAILDAVAARYRVDPNRIVATGISLGSNFSIALAAAVPDRFAAIVPVSTEGESREWVLRNLLHVPAYVLEGRQDANIRAIEGPRMVERLLRSFGYDVTYREFDDRGHEGFEDQYPDVLRWLAVRPRPIYPRHVLRVPHAGIMPSARRQYWIESDTRQALVDARADAVANRIDLTVRWARRVRVYLHDRLVDLDRPIVVRVNGIEVENRRVDRSVWQAVDGVRRRGDTGAVFPAVLDIEVPEWEASVAVGQRLHASLAPQLPESPLSFWETYAIRALEDRLPPVGLTGQFVSSADGPSLPGEQMALSIEAVEEASPFAAAGLQPGDLLLEVDGEPFYEGGSLEALRQWLMKELTDTPRAYPLLVWRDGRTLTLTATLRLDPVTVGTEP